MTVNELHKYASHTNSTHDHEYNKGRKDCIEGYIYTKEAKYFQLVENISGKEQKNE